MITTSKKYSITEYFMLVIYLSIPFWVLGAFIDLTKYIPIKLPISALMFFCPMLAAIILTSKNGESGDLKLLLNRIFDVKKIKHKYWLFLAISLIPVLMYLTYLVMIFLHLTLPKPEIKLSTTLIFIILFFIGSIGEEVGWTGFITDPMQQRFGALKASLMLGIIWAIWHIIPYIQTHRNAKWIVWQCVGTVALRIIMVWLYNNSNRSLFAVIVCHTSINVSVNLFPNNGSHYDPFYFGIILILMAGFISFFGFSRKNLKAKWKPKMNYNE